MAHLSPQTEQHHHADHQLESGERMRTLTLITISGWEYELVVQPPTPIHKTDFRESQGQLGALTNDDVLSNRDNNDDIDCSDSEDFFDAESSSEGDDALDADGDDDAGNERFFDALEAIEADPSHVDECAKSEEDLMEESLDEVMCEWREMMQLMKLGDVYTYYK